MCSARRLLPLLVVASSSARAESAAAVACDGWVWGRRCPADGDGDGASSTGDATSASCLQSCELLSRASGASLSCCQWRGHVQSCTVQAVSGGDSGDDEDERLASGATVVAAALCRAAPSPPSPPPPPPRPLPPPPRPRQPPAGLARPTEPTAGSRSGGLGGGGGNATTGHRHVWSEGTRHAAAGVATVIATVMLCAIPCCVVVYCAGVTPRARTPVCPDAPPVCGQPSFPQTPHPSFTHPPPLYPLLHPPCHARASVYRGASSGRRSERGRRCWSGGRAWAASARWGRGGRARRAAAEAAEARRGQGSHRATHTQRGRRCDVAIRHRRIAEGGET